MVRPKIVFVSSSAQKISDVRYYLGDAVEIESAEIDLPELQGTVEEIAKDKCRKAANTASTLMKSTWIQAFSEKARVADRSVHK
jgi:inosine/xanthosine triphosphate pyrophosphatase family protein